MLLALAALAIFPVSAAAHSPHDVIARVVVSPDFENDRIVLALVTLTSNNLLVRSTDAGRSWTYIGTALANRIVDDLTFSPDWVNDGTLYAASPTQGVWRSTDRGLTWQPSSAGLTTNTVRAIACSPDFAADGTLLAATAQGLFRSTDRGDSWAPYGTGLTETHLMRMGWISDGLGGSVAFVARKTMHVSYDGGLNWMPTGTFANVVESLAVSPGFTQDGSLAVSFGRFGGGVQFSTNGGLGFSAMNAGLTDFNVNELAIADDGTMFGVTDTAGCFRADGIGATWGLFIDGFEEPSDLTNVHNVSVSVSPTFSRDSTVFVGAYEGLYRSFSRGDSWRQLDVYTQGINRYFVLSPQFAQDGVVLLGNYGGAVFRYAERSPLPAPTLHAPPPVSPGPGGGSGPPGGLFLLAPGPPAVPQSQRNPQPVPDLSRRRDVSWTPLGTNVTTPWSAAFVASNQPIGQRMLLYGYTGLWKSFDEGQTWISANKPAPISVVRGLGISPDFANDGMVFTGSGGQGTFVSHDSATTWSLLPDLPADLACTEIVFSPGFASDGTLFVVSRNRGIWTTGDAGASWVRLLALVPSSIARMVVSPNYPSDGLLIAAGTDSGLFRSVDGGSSWAAANIGLPTDSLLLAQGLVISPDFAQDESAWVSLQNHGVWRTQDAGLSWQACGPLSAPPMQLAISPQFAEDGTLFAGSHAGTFVSRDAGQSWTRLPGYARVDDRHPSVHYSADWSNSADPAGFTGGTSRTLLPGRWTEHEGYGNSLSWWGRTLPTGAIAWVSVDGGPLIAVDTWSETSASQVKLFERTWAEPGWHTLRVIHSGTANPSSGGLELHSDGFERLEF